MEHKDHKLTFSNAEASLPGTLYQHLGSPLVNQKNYHISAHKKSITENEASGKILTTQHIQTRQQIMTGMSVAENDKHNSRKGA